MIFTLMEFVCAKQNAASIRFSVRSRSVAKFFSRSHGAVIRVYDAAGNVIETYEHKGDSRNGEVLQHRIHSELVNCGFQL